MPKKAAYADKEIVLPGSECRFHNGHFFVVGEPIPERAARAWFRCKFCDGWTLLPTTYEEALRLTFLINKWKLAKGYYQWLYGAEPNERDINAFEYKYLKGHAKSGR